MPERWEFPALALDRLAHHIVRGDVVFFIGAGLSLDTEGNSASRLVQRLLLRLLALGECFSLGGFRDELKDTFDLAVPRGDDAGQAPYPFTDADVEKLAYRYYETNEWFCGTFARILHDVASKTLPTEWAARARQVGEIERRIRDRPVAAGDASKPLDVALQDSAQLADLLPKLLRWAQGLARQPGGADAWRHAGKALFLDTLGFRDSSIMRGAPEAALARQVADSYGGRLLPRHHVLARFAREGLCTTTLTANYDLLLEGAFRLAGFRMVRGLSDASAADEVVPSTEFASFARIAGPAAFFSDGKAHRTPMVVKMHGCVLDYRMRGYEMNARQLIDYLPSMVFTYREIQNWRRDSWAADFLRTLLRTRTVVFAGYSLQDPVIHDTFRTVYEEMAALGPAPPDSEPVTPEQAPAFFFAPGKDKREFYGLEVLQAASAAVGAPRASGVHPNYLRFHLRTSDRSGFPNLDDLFIWLQHRVLRRHQMGCLETHLRRTMAVFLGRPRPLEEIEAVHNHFGELCRREQELAEAWSENRHAQGRYEHGRLCGWTDAFHPGLLREFAAVDLLQQQKGPGTELARLRRLPWYYPSSQDSRWTCWAIVLEIAIRRMVRAAVGVDAAVPDHKVAWCARGQVPTVLFARPGEAPCALAIYLAGFDPDSQLTRIEGHVVRHCSWQLAAGDALWPRATGFGPDRASVGLGSSHRSVLQAPPSRVIWQWACQPDGALGQEEAKGWLDHVADPRSKRAVR